MRLTRARVQNYRSIVDSGIVNIEEIVTVLIGKNEQGKTNFLAGLGTFNKEHTYSAADFPNHRPSAIHSVGPGAKAVASQGDRPLVVKFGERVLARGDASWDCSTASRTATCG